jgi:tetratricopeptide (TPR) repeat protein
MHTGVNTGTVLAGRTDLEGGSETVVGDAVNLASRMKDTAHAGQILVGPDTYRMTAALFEYEVLSPVRLKGKAEPVPVYRMLGTKRGTGRERVVGTHGVTSPLVGREEAMSVLTRCFDRLRENRGGIVFVLGEAGVGKSRLIAEMRRRVQDWPSSGSGATGELQSLEGRSLSYGQTISYWAFQEIVREYAGIGENDGEAEAWRKLESRVASLFDGETKEVLPYLACLLAMKLRSPYVEGLKDLDSEVMGRRVYLASRRFFERLAMRQPLILVFEDTHWMDESSALLLEHLLPLVERAPLLICCASRPDTGIAADRLRESAARDHAAWCTELRLAPLSPPESERLAGNVLDLESLSPHIREQIVGKAEGNPFFLEEILRALIDGGAVAWDSAAGRWKATERIAAIVIPDSVEGVIMSRVDRLDEPVKEVLRTAAVIGRSFFSSVLHAVTEADTGRPERTAAEVDEHLARLQAIEIIREKQRLPELEYIYTHALARDAIYASILQQRRRELHARVGAAMEALFAHRIEEFYGLLAYHYAQAEAWEKAKMYLLLSGNQAERVAADSEALALYRQAMAVYMKRVGSELLPVQRAMVERKMGEALARQGKHSQALEHLMRALAQLGKPLPTTRGSVLAAIPWEALTQVGHRLSFKRRSGRADTSDDPAMQEEACAYQSIGWILGTTDPLLALLSVLKLANSCERGRFLAGAVTAYSMLSFFFDEASLLRLADSYARRVLSAIGEIRASGTIGLAHATLAIHENTRARWSEVREHARRAIEAYGMGGFWNITGWRLARLDLADADIHEGNFDRALAHAQELVRLGHESGDRETLSWGLSRQGFAQKGLGDIRGSIDSLTEAMKLLKSIPDYLVYLDCGGELGQCHLRLGEVERAVTVFAECARVRVEHNMMKSPVCTRFVNGTAEAYLLLAEHGDSREKARALRKARAACREALRQGRAYLPGMPEAMMLRGTCEWVRGRHRAAEGWWERSRALAEEKGVRYDLARTLTEMGRREGNADHLERAQSLFAEMGAAWDVSKARTIAASIGRRI